MSSYILLCCNEVNILPFFFFSFLQTIFSSDIDCYH